MRNREFQKVLDEAPSDIEQRVREYAEQAEMFAHLRTPRDWDIDFSHDNGRYQNTCIDCKKTFFGHKRRVICQTCWINH